MTIDMLKIHPDVIVLSEVKLKVTAPLQLYNIVNYEMRECLRVGKGGGGVIIYAKKDIFVDCSKSNTTSFESLDLYIKVDNIRFRVLAYYRAPSTPVNDFLDDVESKISSNNSMTFLCGDININGLPSDCDSSKYVSLLSSYGYAVTNNIRTRDASGRIIDHAAANFHQQFDICNDTIVFDKKFSDHNIVITSVPFIRIQKLSQSRTISTVDYELLGKYFFLQPSDLEKGDDSNLIADKIIGATKRAIEHSTSIKTYNVKRAEKLCDWACSDVLDAMKEKDKWLKKRRRNRKSEKYRRKLSKATIKLEKCTKKAIINAVMRKTSERDPKKMWRNLNEIMGRSRTEAHPDGIRLANGNLTCDALEVANEFNQHFTSCAELLNGCRTHYGEEPVGISVSGSMVLEPTDNDEVTSVILSLKNGSASGSDKISPKVVKNLQHQLTPLLVTLVNSMFASGVYPTAFKNAIVTPIYKGGGKDSVDNYRPISVLTIFNKIIERLILNRLTSFTEEHLKLIYPYQFGFRRKTGTECAATELVSHIQQALNEKPRANKKCKTVVSVVFMDLRKAFDLVDHELLLQVLWQYGIRGMVHQLVENYLKGRSQQVKIGETLSCQEPIKTGVVQGSCLGPWLFLLYINAIGSLQLKGRIFLYADDAALVNIHTTEAAIENTVKADMMQIIKYLNRRKMLLNASKTSFMLISSPLKKPMLSDTMNIGGGLTISRVKVFKYLGLYIDEHLDWHEHTSHLNRKLAATNGVLWKLRHVLPFNAKMQVYNALFMAHLTYMIPLWGFSSHKSIKHLQVLQNRALRNIFKLPRLQNRVEMYGHLVHNNLPLRAICLANTAMFMYNAMHSNVRTNIIFENVGIKTNRRLRNAQELRTPQSHNKYGQQSMVSVGPSVFNHLPEEIKNAAHHHNFKKKLKSILHSENFIEKCFDNNFLNHIYSSQSLI